MRFRFAFFLTSLAAVFVCGMIPAQAQQAAPAVAAPPPVVVPAPAQSGQNVDQLLQKIQNDPATAATAQPLAAPAPGLPVPQEVTGAQVPPLPSGTPAAPPLKPVDTATDVPAIPALPASQTPNENLFFDSESLVPKGEMRTGAPREVNPSLEPGSKLILVTKGAPADSQEAQLVAAQRAVMLGRYDSAVRIYDELYQKNKRDPNILLGRAVALQKIGRDDDAMKSYEDLLDVQPDNMQAQLNMLGLIGGHYPAVALQRLNALRDKHPNDAGIVAQIAVVQARLGQNADALASLGMASSLQPDNALHVFNMAVIADRMGKKPDAVQYYQKALEIDTIYGGGRSVPREAIYDRLAQIR